jgi:NADP-dependent 3-hydroxy acid dehydrogenase YdfG
MCSASQVRVEKRIEPLSAPSRSKHYELKGKVALITAAASGIGHAIAKRYVEADGRVVFADIDPTRAAQAATETARRA